MPTLSSHVSAHTTSSSKRDGADFEPDDEWKRQLKENIEESFKSMIQEAKDNQKAQVGIISQERLDWEYKQALQNIKGLAEEQYQLALMKERNERRWIAGVQMLPGWTDVLHDEQQNIMNSIKQSNNTDNSARVAESPTDERATNRSPPLSSAHHESLPQSSDPVTTREAPTRDRRRHDNNNNNNTRSSSRDPDDHAPPPSSSSLRRHKANQHRPTLAEIFTAEPTEDPEEDHHQHTPSRPSSGRPRSNSEKPRDSSLGKSSGSLRSVASSDRHIGRSPPKASPIQNPDLRRSSTASLDDAPPPSHPPSTKYQIGRRGSTASIRSTGSGHSGKSIRQPTTETIPERADDVEESPSSSAVNERMRKSTADKPPRDKDSKRGSRRDSRPTPVDPNVLHRYEHEPPSNLRSAGPSSATMQYATSTSTSFGEDRFHHPPVERERSLKSSRSYLESDPPYHGREAPYAPRDMPPSARPGPAPPPRYGGAGDDRDFVGPYPPLGHPVGPGSPFVDRDSLRGDRDRDSLREREYHSPISHKASFGSYDGGRRREWDGPPPHWDEDREARDRDSRGREYWERDRERGRDWDHQRDRERERDRELYERQHREREYPHPHSTPYSSRTAGYPTPPSSASRVAQPPHAGVGDYIPMGDIYDYDEPSPSSARAGPPAGYPNYRTGPPPPITLLPSDERDYSPRPESGRPSMPLRQPSYGRREGERRGTIDGPPDLASDAYSTRSYAHVPGAAPPPGSIPIPWSPNGGLDETPAWQNWHAEGGGRHRPPSINSNNNANANETWARSPTNPSVLSTSSGGPPHAPSSLLRPTSVAPVAEDHQRRTTERRASVKAYHGNQGHPNMNVNRPNRDVEYPEDRYSPVPIPVPPPHPPSHPHPHAPGIRNRVLLDEDREDEGFASTDSAQSHSASEEEESERDDRHHGEEDEDEDDEEEEEEEEQEEDEIDRQARLERERREAADTKIRSELKRLQDEERRMEEEARTLEEEVRQKEEEVRQKEEEMQRKEAEVRRKEEAERLAEARRAAERLAEEARKKEEDATRKEKEVKKREEDARRKAEDARKLKSETMRKEAEVKIKEAETMKKEEQLKAEQFKLKQEAERLALKATIAREKVKKQEEETRKKEREIQEREAALLLREKQLQLREAEARRKEEDSKREESRRKEEEAREASKRREEEEREAAKRREEAEREAAKRREEEEREAAKRREEERETARRREEEAREAKRRDDEAREALRRREEEARAAKERNRREAARRQQESERQMQDDDYLASLDPKFVEEQARLLQQAQFRKREEEIKRTRERKRNDSIGAESAWMPPFASASPTGTYAAASNANAYPSSSPNTHASASPGTSPGMSRSFNSGTNGTPSWNTSNSAWSSATKPTTNIPSSNARTSSSIPSPFGKPRTGSVSAGTNLPNASTLGSEEWARRQQEFVNDQQERFRREQEKIEAENQLRSAGKPLSREEMTRLFETHERLWNQIAVPTTEQFTWSDIPWPMAKMPMSPEDISQALIAAYMQSPWWPEKDKAKSTKDRIKDSLKRWHPDRFDNRCLVRVIDSDQERVKEASGNVVRYLNELLRKENEGANGIFAGD